MLLFILAYLGGVLTLASPCILPVLPFVFTRAGLPFTRAGLPMLIGMAASFALVASLAAVAGGWVVATNQAGRWLALGVLAFFGAALLWPAGVGRYADRLTAPIAASVASLGVRLSNKAGVNAGIGGSLLLGVATGFLWAPCAGPILGLILTGAALSGPNANTSLLLAAYAAGAATSLALALAVGGRVLAAMKRTFGFSDALRRGMGALVLAAVGAIALGLDTGVLAQWSQASTDALETRLMAGLQLAPDAPNPGQSEPQATPAMMMAAGLGESSAMMAADVNANPAMMMSANPAMMMSADVGGAASASPTALPIEGTAPPLEGATHWLNSPPLSLAALKGKVVLIDFWTYSCINCLRAIPYVRAWAEKYKDQGLVVIGVHAPEFAFERNVNNVERAIAKQKIPYPVAVDNGYAIWRAYQNRYWPAHYFIDAQGRIRHHQFGEGHYEQSERVIQQLLAEAGQTNATPEVVAGFVSVAATGDEAAPDFDNVLSPETYLGWQRAENFVSPGGMLRDTVKRYADGNPRLNEWGLNGQWAIRAEHARLADAPGSLVMRFHARDLHLVLAPTGKPVRFKVTLDGQPPGDAHGMDVNAAGEGIVSEERLYQLIRQPGNVTARRIEVEFLDAGVEAYALTFG